MSEITVSGLVATTPRYLVAQDGTPIVSFRLASSMSDRDETNWFTITGFNSLATNMSESISKGDRILVFGDLRIRDWDNGERTGTTAEIVAKNVGPDLAWGKTTFERNILVQETRPTPNGSTVLGSALTVAVSSDAAQHSCDCRHCNV